MAIFNLLALLAAEGVPSVSAVLFIVGAAFFIVGTLYGWARAPWDWDRGVGVGLMVLAIGFRVIFGI